MFLNYASNFVLLLGALIASALAQSSSTGKINSNSPSGDSAANPAGAADPNQQNQAYQYNQGIQPYSYGYNTGIRPYSYSYTYPQNGGKPQITYQNLQQPQAQPQPQQYQGMMPMQPAYYGQQGYPPMQPMGYGYPMQQGYPPQMQFQPMQANGPPPTIPPIPELANLGGDFDLSNLGAPPAANANNANNANAAQQANPLGDFNLDNLAAGPAAGGAANSNQNNNAGGLQAPDLNAELANLADPSSVAGTGGGGANNQANNGAGLPAGVPQGLGDFNIDGLGSDRLTNTNNNQANNPMTGLPDIQSLMGVGGGSPGPGDFADLTNLANLANGNPIGSSASPVSRTATTGNAGNNAPVIAGLPDFNFGGSNNNLDFNMNNLPSASNLDFDLNFPSPSELKLTKLKSDKLPDSSKNKKQPPKPDKKEKQSNQSDKQAGGKKLVKNRRSRSLDERLETAESLQTQGLQDLEIDPDSPRGMLNINPQYQNPYQGVYSQYPAYRIM